MYFFVIKYNACYSERFKNSLVKNIYIEKKNTIM